MLKNLYVNVFCTSWPILTIKMSSRVVFRVLNRLERVLLWPEVRIVQNDRHFYLSKLYFYSCWFIIDTGSPWTRIGHHAPPTTLHFDQELPGNVVSDVTRNNFEARYGFQPLFINGRHENLILGNISTSKCHRIIFLVGQEIEWNHIEKYWVIPIWRILKNSRWQLVKIILWQNLNVYFANKICKMLK